jgi:SAM-dependent methyltransferase
MANHVITYDDRTVNSRNPLARYAHRSRIVRSQQLCESYLPEAGTLVDFGAGTGLLLHELRERLPSADLIGVEPYMQPSYPESARYVPDLSSVGADRADVVGAFEVCEHLHEWQVKSFLSESATVLRSDGRLIISVPITIGAAAIVKKLNFILFYGNRQLSLVETLRNTLGLPVERSSDPRFTHQGFDFRWLRELVLAKFEIEHTHLSPLPRLPWYLNSQVFFVCKPKSCP